MRNQTELRYFIGAPRLPHAFTTDVLAGASAVCGGCTLVPSHGIWRGDGAEHKEVFTATMESESCLQIILTCEDAKLEGVMAAMQEYITSAAIEHAVDADWVHVQASPITGHHFSIKAQQQAAPSKPKLQLVHNV